MVLAVAVEGMTAEVVVALAAEVVRIVCARNSIRRLSVSAALLV